jgi:hypothetical protein
VKTQIWIAVSVYVLVAIVKKLTLDASLYRLLQILSVTLFEKIPMAQALTGDDTKDDTSQITNQLSLFAYCPDSSDALSLPACRGVPSTRRVCALRFFFGVTLGRAAMVERIP